VSSREAAARPSTPSGTPNSTELEAILRDALPTATPTIAFDAPFALLSFLALGGGLATRNVRIDGAVALTTVYEN
jgi:hypothetical protein